jgi:hypothetical protein
LEQEVLGFSEVTRDKGPRKKCALGKKGKQCDRRDKGSNMPGKKEDQCKVKTRNSCIEYQPSARS